MKLKQMMFMLTCIFSLAAWCGTAAETKSIVLPSNGIYVFDLKGDFYTSESWNVENNNTVVGIALITDNTKALIALRNANTDGYVVWGPDGLVDGVVTTASNYSNCVPGVAQSDYNGISNTQKEVQQLSPQSNTALYLANAYIFPDNHNGYLPALGELIDMFDRIEAVNDLLEKVDGEKIEDFWYWSSTQHYLYYRAWAYGGTDSPEGRWFAQLRNENSPLVSSYGPCRINVRAFGVIPKTMEIENEGNEPTVITINGRECVDLNLPSGTLWATCNIGADSPEQFGNYYDWNRNFVQETWDDSWRTPTKEDRDELVQYCTYSRESINDVKGARYTGSNGQSIFFPFGGYYQSGYGPYKVGIDGLYWTTTECEYEDKTHWILRAESSEQKDDYAGYWPKYYFGFSVRAVCNKSNIILDKCATPTIAYDKGELVFSCETEDVTFVSEVKVVDAKTNEGERVQLMPTYEITVYATKEGYDNSEVATATIQWRDGRPLLTGFSNITIDGKAANDTNGDGAVDVADIATIISEMAAQARKQGNAGM